MLHHVRIFILGCVCVCSSAQNEYGDYGIVFTGLPAEIDEEYQNIISVPNMPIDIENTTEHYPGFNFGLAFDWISHNIYWTDPLMGWIAMQPGGAINDPSQYKVIVSEHLQLPRGIAVDPINGYLFWTDFNVIERSSLTGENRQKIIFKQLTDPTAIVADHVSKRIYWTDIQFIDSATYDGTQRTHVVRENNVRYFDVALFEDILIVTDIHNYFAGEIPYSAKFYNKTTGQELKDKRLHTTREAYFGVCLYTERVQPPQPDLDHCENANCQDICVNEPSGAKCLCREGFQLQGDNRRCQEIGGKHQRAIIVNTGRDLCLLDIRVLSDHHNFSPECFYNGTDGETISYFDVDMISRTVLYALIEGYDGHTDLMGIEYNGSVSHYVATDRPITDFAIYKEYVVLVNKDNDGKYQIQTGDLGLGMPLQIVNEGVIKTLSEIKGIKMLDETMQVHYPNKMIYWVDGYLDRIYKSGYGGDFREIFLEVEKGLQMTDIDLVGQYLYYTALKKNTITRVNKNNKNDIKQLGPDVGLGVLYALDVYDSTASTNIPAKPGITVTQTDNDDNVAIGVGIGVSLLVLMIIVAIVMVICIRTGKISSPFKKQSAESNQTTFENPRYIGNNVQLGGTGTEANASFGYSTLHEDRVSSTNAFPKSSTRSSNSQHTNRFS
ncbi:Transcription activator BRG1 [Mactra antiquata]